ncbi:MAG: hypothetical protein EOO90_25060 [Pedobacter sp.]|nr:MAG: hypothetical protein EOO90_25060 [Pedobacter sp.]
MNIEKQGANSLFLRNIIMENQNKGNKEEASPQDKSFKSANENIPTSAGGQKDHDYEGGDEETGQVKSEIDEDAESRVKDSELEEKQPQINNEGEFNKDTGWMREEGLSDEERKAAEEEGF